MNIYLSNCHNTFNYGSMMMCENFIYYSQSLSPEHHQYFVEADSQEDVDRLTHATGIESIIPVKREALFIDNMSGLYLASGYLGIKNIVTDLVKKIDLVVVLGGDDFTEDYGWKGPVRLALKLNFLKRYSLPIVLLGQTMGPFLSFRKPIMKQLLKNMDKIYTRDSITERYLAELGFKNITLMDDIALLPLARQESEPVTREFITFCPSELIYRYSVSGDRRKWNRFNLFMIEQLMTQFADKKLVLLAHVLKPSHVDDRIIVNELYDHITTRYGDRIVLVNEATYPYVVRKYIQASVMTVSSRMHPIISSLQCEVPIIALSYSTKYWGIIGERYELEKYLLDVRHMDFDEMQMRFISCIDQIKNNGQQIRDGIKQKNESATGTIMRSLNEIMKIRAGKP